jgi:hypothetical protein
MIIGANRAAIIYEIGVVDGVRSPVIVHVALTPFGGHGVMRLEGLPRGGCSVASRSRPG